MANKPFVIQSSTLTIGGVDLQAGSNGVVIPGVTQATNYFAEEVERLATIGGNNPNTFGSDANAITVIDNSRYLALTGTAPSGVYVAATYSVDEVDDGRIEGVDVESGGTFAAADKTRVEAANMWATTTPTPFVSFNSANWTQIPYRPKMRAGEVENVGGGGNADTGNFTFSEDTITNDNGLLLATDRGTLAIGTNMEAPGVAQHFHIAFDSSNSSPSANDLFLGDDYNYVKLPGYELNITNPYGVEIGTHYRGGPQNVAVTEVDELVPPGGVWRLFISDSEYPNLGATVSVGDPVDIAWGSQISATITEINQVDGDWQIQVDQDITAGFNAGPKTVSFGSQGNGYVWRFGTDGSLTLPAGGTISYAPDDTDNWNAPTVNTVQAALDELAARVTASGGAVSLTDSGDVVVSAGSTEHWVATQRRNNEDTRPRGQRYDSQGNLYTLTQSGSDQGNITVITKYTAAGAVAWQRSFTDASATALAVDSNDCAYITLNVGGPEITVIKFSTAGSPLWKKNYEIGVAAFGAFIEEKSATTLVLAFSIQDGGTFLVVVMEINASTGAVEIKRQIAFTSLDQPVVIQGIDVDPNENVFVTGLYYDTGDEKNKMFVEKLDENLLRVWSKSLETANTYDMYGGDCASDALGNIYVVGSYQVDTANSNLEFSGPQSAGILAKLNSLGVVQWTRRLGPGPCGSFATGLTVTPTGNVYLSAVTFSKDTSNITEGYPEFVLEAFGSNKMIVVRYDTQGAVIWQRYVDVANLYEQWDNEQLTGQAVAVYGDKFAVAGYGWSTDNVPFNASSSDDNEYDCFVVQLPTDGTALTIGNLDFTESRVPARFITHTATTSPLDNTVWTTSVTLSNSTLVADTETRIANNIVKSETYAYTFGANGTLTIPNDGDLQLTQSQVGYLMAIGGSDNNNDNIYGRAVTVDSQGNMYVVGNEDDDNQSFVTKLSSDGARQWSVRIIEDSEGWDNRANGITIHPTTGNLMVVCEVYDSYTYSILVTLDQDTGRILNTETFSDSNSDVYLNDIAYNSTGAYVLAGSKNGEFTEEFPVTKQTGSDTGVIKILRSAVPGPASTSWQIGGTGFSVFENILNVERYTGVTGTVRQGSGATFTIADNGDGTYGVSAPTLAGTNYRVGHKIKVLGTEIGGATPANDCVVTVNEINPTTGAITILGNVSGTAAGVAYQAYNDRSGANYNVGSGLEFTFHGPRRTTNYDDEQWSSITAGGTNYVANDVVVVLGTSLGGTTPANDLTVTVGVSGTAVQYFDSVSGTSQSTTWKLETTTQVDFAGTGSWLITYPLSRQNLLVTPTWQRTFGTSGDDTDRLYAVSVDTGNNIITVGEGYGELASGNFRDLAIVYKFNSTGTVQWAKQLNERNDHCYAKSVVTIGTDIYVTHDSNDDGDTVITKLDSTGAVKWQRGTDSGDDSSIARTADGNLLVTAEAYNEDLDQTALKVFLLTPSGETVYQRWLMATTDGNTQFKNGRCLAVSGDSYYITAYFYANNYTSSMAARLPVDGSGTGEYGSFRYVGVNAFTGSFGPNGLTGINYDIVELDLEDANNYAGALALVTDPYVNEIELLVGSGAFFVDTFDTPWDKQTVRDTDGGSIIFPDGTKQNTSATDIPQRRYWGQRYTLGLKDRGHHILCENSDDNIQIPYWARVNFPIGTVITFVNTSGNNVYISQEGGSIGLILAGSGSGISGVTLTNNGIATLLMIGLDSWIISGNVTATNP